MIGSALSVRLRKDGWRVVGTTHRREKEGPDCVFLDLESPSIGLDSVHVAVLCAGITRIAECRKSPEKSFRLNVLAVEALTKQLVASGAFVIFPSVNQVFDGSKPFARSDDPIAPRSEYGRQKAEAERRLETWKDAVAIVRFTKVLGSSYSVLDSWIEAWRRGEAARPFTDLTMAPVDLDEACSLVSRLAELRAPGIYHVSGARDISYADAAAIGAEIFEVESDRVQPVKVRDSGVDLEHVPLHTALDCSLARERLGFIPPEPRPVLEKYFRNSHAH